MLLRSTRLGFFSYLPVLASILLVSAVTGADMPAHAQTAPVHTKASTVADTTDLHFHKFVPKVSPELASNSATATQSVVDPSTGLSAFAMNQINALEQEKDARTPVQQKIDSNILYTVRMMQGRPAAPGVDYLETGIDLDDNNNIVVDIAANVTDALRARLAAAGATVLDSNVPLHSIRAIIPPAAIEGIAASSDVLFVGPKQDSYTNRMPTPTRAAARTMSPALAAKAAKIRDMVLRAQSSQTNSTGTPSYGQGSVETEGDLAHQAVQARGTYGINGAGLKIGVLSDNVTTIASSQALGDIPPTCGNGVPSPCMTVLPGQAGTGAGDEGTAILEIVHDMVPGADLYFATANTSITSFATNIRALQTAGCNIIIDDVGYYIENPFQDGQASTVVSTSNGGVVTQAVNDVVAAGAYYFSSAANSGNQDSATSGTYEGDFVPMTPPTLTNLPTTGKIHNFGTVASPLAYDAITVAATPIYLFWADPLGGSTNDYDLYLSNVAGTSITNSSTNVQSATRDAYESLGSATAYAVGRRIYVYQKAGAANVFFHLNIARGQLAVTTSGETHGHGAASGAYTVAATPALTPYSTTTPTGPYPNPFSTTNQIETFSSDGFRRIFFNADSTPITAGNFLAATSGGKLLMKPEITGADGVSVTGVGGFGTPFYGTSAAAPSAASVAALVLSAKPSITPAQMKTALTSTAVDIMASGIDQDSGSGIVMALAAVKSTGATGGANPEFGTITATENPGDGNGAIEAGEGGVLTISLKNTTGVLAATGITATLTTSTPGVTLKLPATSTYPDLPVGAGPQNNNTPFQFTLASNFGCVTTVNFALTVSYSSGMSRVLKFSVPVGLLTITNTIGTTVTPPAGITFGTGSIAAAVGRLSRSGVASVCGTAKTYPGAVTTSGNPHAYDTYTFQSCAAGCVATQLTSPSAVAANIFESVYSPTFTGTSLQTNYIGDGGQSNAIETAAFTAAANTKYTVVVSDVNGNPPTSNIPNNYTVSIPSCSLKCSIYPLPVTITKNVTVATTGTSAAASIDNGSNDPNGGPITLSQSPAGPYPLGTTTVTLTTTNKFGAFTQGTGTVTVTTATKLLYAVAPPALLIANGNAGVVKVAITDASGNIASSNSTDTITVTIVGPSGFSSMQSAVALNGVASVDFSAVPLPTAGAYTFTATDGGLDSAIAFVTVVPAALEILNADGSVSRFASTGQTINQSSTSGTTAVTGSVAVDASGTSWVVTNPGTLRTVKTDGTTVAVAGLTSAGVNTPTSVVVDGYGQVWVTNGASSVSELDNSGNALSPSSGYTGMTTTGTGYSNPAGIAIDVSGNVWVSNAGSNTVIEILGAAGPIAPPATAVTGGTPGTRP